MIANLPKQQGRRLCLLDQKWKIIHSLSSRNPLFTLHEMVLQNVVPDFGLSLCQCFYIGYRIIAKYRHKFFKRPTECLFRID